jgi:hypothetical protein
MTAWLQKHPSPSGSDGAFHWHGDGGTPDERARFVERMRGVTAPAVLWSIAPGRVLWATVWSAVSPIDHRAYTGMTLACAASLAELPTVPCGPFGSASSMPSHGDRVRLARAALGGTVTVEGVDVAELDELDRALPRSMRAGVREGAAKIGRAAAKPDRVAELLAAGDDVWAFVRDLADARREHPDAIFEPPAPVVVEKPPSDVLYRQIRALEARLRVEARRVRVLAIAAVAGIVLATVLLVMLLTHSVCVVEATAPVIDLKAST